MNPYFLKLAQLASGIKDPVSVAAFATVLAFAALYTAMKSRRYALGWLLAVSLLILGLAPILTDTYLASSGEYEVRVEVLDEDHNPVDAALTCDRGGESTRTTGGWLYKIPFHGNLWNTGTFRASIKERSLTGSKTIAFERNPSPPAVTIQLAPLPSVPAGGVVVDKASHLPIEGATVTVDNSKDSVPTNANGSFTIPTHVAAGQPITVRARKGGKTAESSQASTTAFRLELE